MGVRIAAHLANAGIPVVLLDLAGDTGKCPSPSPNARRALSRAKPAAFLRPSQYRADPTRNLRPRPGASFQMRLGDRGRYRKPGHQAARLLAKITPFLKPGVILTTNTSGLPVATHRRAAAARAPPLLVRYPLLQSAALHEAARGHLHARRPIRRPLPPLPILPTVVWAKRSSTPATPPTSLPIALASTS